MLFSAALLCCDNMVDLFVFCITQTKRLGVSTTEITAISLNTLRRQVCVSSHHGVSPIFRPGGSKVPNPNLRHNAVQLGTRRLTRTPWTTQPELEDLRQQHNAEEKGWWCFFLSSQQKLKKNEKNAWNLDLAKLNLGIWVVCPTWWTLNCLWRIMWSEGKFWIPAPLSLELALVG